ncbi:unnamed protein product, partial [Meganyctiphanes norvegica]
MPPELEYSSIEPVIRFVYSGRLDVRGSQSEMTAIYMAAQRLKVSLLTRLMDRRFPYLTPTPRANTAKLPIWKRSPSKVVRQQKNCAKQGSKETNSIESNKIEDDPLSDHCETQQTKIDEDTYSEDKDIIAYGKDHSVYLLQTNSQKIAQANAAVRRKRPAEEARPTRFELEEPDEDSDEIGTWVPRTSPPPLPNIFTTSPNSSNDSPTKTGTKTRFSARMQTRKIQNSVSGISSKYSSSSKENTSNKMDIQQSQDPFDLLTLASEQELGGINHGNWCNISNKQNLAQINKSENSDVSVCDNEVNSIRHQEKKSKLEHQDKWPNINVCYNEYRNNYKDTICKR